MHVRVPTERFFLFIDPLVRQSDMNAEMRTDILDIITTALEKYGGLADGKRDYEVGSEESQKKGS